jgi:two-component system, NarL family, invasion response regulator UvrY
MRIVLVDDHPVVRRGIRSLLEERLPDSTIVEAGEARSAMRLVRSGGCDLVIADISLPGMSGLDLIKEIRREFPQLPAIVVSIHPAAQFARRALNAGAGAFLMKTSEPGEFVAAIETVQRGETYVARTAPEPHSAPPNPRHESLSDREYQVLRMLGAGRTVSDIARELSLSVKTVSTYRIRALEKLGMRTSAELMRYAIENGLVE